MRPRPRAHPVPLRASRHGQGCSAWFTRVFAEHPVDQVVRAQVVLPGGKGGLHPSGVRFQPVFVAEFF